MSKQSLFHFLQPLELTAVLVLGLALPLRLSAAESAPATVTVGGPVAVQPGGFKYFVGIVGNPSVPDISWSDEELEQIKALGVNMVQLSIAWGGKPANEVLNLEDLDAEQRAKWAFRIKQAKKHGLKTIAQFGIPRMINYSPVQPACILDLTVQKKYQELLTDFMTSFPEVDDVMVYTFDQRAWLCSEYGPCPRCTGVPLDERVPQFLNLLNETMQKCRPNTRLWWKPWELSRGQIVTILGKVNPAGFGLALNPSTSNEVYPFNDRSFKSDLGVKRFVQLAKEHGIPVLGEFDHTFYKPLYLIEDFFPRLIYEQMNGWKEMPGIVGVKEYYGFSPSVFSVNAAMLKAWMKSPEASLDTLLQEIVAPYGSQTAPLLQQVHRLGQPGRHRQRLLGRPIARHPLPQRLIALAPCRIEQQIRHSPDQHHRENRQQTRQRVFQQIQERPEPPDQGGQRHQPDR